MNTGWWNLTTTIELTNEDREHIAQQILKGNTEGQIVHIKFDDLTDLQKLRVLSGAPYPLEVN